MPAQIVADDGQDSTFTPEQVKAAVFIQTRWRGIMARKKARKLVAQKRGVTFQEDDDGTALTRKQLDELALAEREAEEREILHAEIFGRIAAMLADGDQEVQRVGATASRFTPTGMGRPIRRRRRTARSTPGSSAPSCTCSPPGTRLR